MPTTCLTMAAQLIFHSLAISNGQRGTKQGSASHTLITKAGRKGTRRRAPRSSRSCSALCANHSSKVRLEVFRSVSGCELKGRHVIDDTPKINPGRRRASKRMMAVDKENLDVDIILCISQSDRQ